MSARLMVLVLVTLSFGCISRFYPTASFTTFGVAQPAADSKVVRTYTSGYLSRYGLDGKPNELHEKSMAAMEAVTVLVDTVPEGIELKDGQITTVEGSPYRLMGKFKLYPDGLIVKREYVLDEVRHLALTAEANVVVMTYLEARGGGEGCAGAVGFFIHSTGPAIDPAKTKSSKLPQKI